MDKTAKRDQRRQLIAFVQKTKWNRNKYNELESILNDVACRMSIPAELIKAEKTHSCACTGMTARIRKLKTGSRRCRLFGLRTRTKI